MQSYNLWPLRLGRHFPAVSKLWQGSPGKSRGRARRPEPPAVRTPRSIHVLTLSPAACTTGTRWHRNGHVFWGGGFPVGRDSVGFRTGRIADGARGESPPSRGTRRTSRESHASAPPARTGTSGWTRARWSSTWESQGGPLSPVNIMDSGIPDFMRLPSPPDRTRGPSRSGRRTPPSPLPARGHRWTRADGSGCNMTR
jgi:hypothetical protein